VSQVSQPFVSKLRETLTDNVISEPGGEGVTGNVSSEPGGEARLHFCGEG
jgi:hypothetical protein